MTILAAGAALSSSSLAAMAADAEAAAPSVMSGYLQMLASLVMVLVVIAGLAWLARRVRGAVGGGSGGIEVLSTTPLGPRERVVLLRARDRVLLLGVAQGHISALTEFAAGELPAAAPAPPTTPNVVNSFAAALRQSLGLKS
jgi:flagellar protein FliO/FliZ